MELNSGYLFKKQTVVYKGVSYEILELVDFAMGISYRNEEHKSRFIIATGHYGDKNIDVLGKDAIEDGEIVFCSQNLYNLDHLIKENGNRVIFKEVRDGVLHKYNSFFFRINDCYSRINNKELLSIIEKKFGKKVALKKKKVGQKKEQIQKNAKLQQMEIEFQGDLPIETVFFLEDIAETHQYLVENPTGTNSLEEIIVCSILLAALNGDELRICEYLGDLGLTFADVEEYLENEICEVETPDYEILKKYYTKFLTEGVNVGVSQKNITPERIFANLFDRCLTKTALFEKIIDYSEITLAKDGQQFLIDFKDYFKKKELAKNLEYFSSFTIEEIEFLEYVSQVFQVLKKKNMEKDALEIEDLKAISVMISVCMLKDRYSEYFEHIGLTLDFIKSFIHIDISEEDIALELKSISIIREEFDAFIEESLPYKKTIIERAFDRGISKSYLPEKMLRYLNAANIDDLHVLLPKYEEHKKEVAIKKAQEEAIKRRDAFFEGFKNDVADFIRLCFVCYNNNKHAFAPGQALSIVGIALSSESIDQESRNLNSKFCLKMLDNLKKIKTFSILFRQTKYNIDATIDAFNEYIFGGHCANKPKEDITILDILSNAYAKLSSFSVFKDFNSWSNDWDYSKKHFTELVLAYQEHLSTQAREARTNWIKEWINVEAQKVLSKTASVQEYFKKDVLDINVALLISLFLCNHNKVKYLHRNNITLDAVLNYYGLSIDGFVNAEFELNDEYVYKVAKPHLSVADPLSPFDRMICGALYFLKKTLFASLNVDMDQMFEEVIDEIKVFNFEELLENLSNIEVKKPDLSGGVLSLLDYGNELDQYAELIKEKYSDLIVLFNEDSIAEVKGLASTLFTEEQVLVSNGFFGVGKEYKAKKEINYGVVENVSQAMQKNLQQVKAEMYSMLSIKNLMDCYLKKLAEFISTLEPEISEQSDEFVIKQLDMKKRSFEFMNTTITVQLASICQRISRHLDIYYVMEPLSKVFMTLMVSNISLMQAGKTGEDSILLTKTLDKLLSAFVSEDAEALNSGFGEIQILIGDNTMNELNLNLDRFFGTAPGGNRLSLEEKKD